jgi:GTPase SAR1 family protein
MSGDGKKVDVLVTGVSHAGKTLLLKTLALWVDECKEPSQNNPDGAVNVGAFARLLATEKQDNAYTDPTRGFNRRPMEFNGVDLLFQEVGGALKPASFKFINRVDVCVFVIDCSDDMTVAQAVYDLITLTHKDESKKCPFVVLLNKADVTDQMSLEDIHAV